MKRQKEDFPPEDEAFVTRTVKIADKLTKILQKDSPNEYIALVALSVVYKAAGTCNMQIVLGKLR